MQPSDGQEVGLRIVQQVMRERRKLRAIAGEGREVR